MPTGKYVTIKSRGRAATPIRLRPGPFIKDHLLLYIEDHPSAIHRKYKEALGKERRKPTFHSFLRYFHALVQLELIEFIGREEPMEFIILKTGEPQKTIPGLLQLRNSTNPRVVPGVCRYYKMTNKGLMFDETSTEWSNPFALLRPQI